LQVAIGVPTLIPIGAWSRWSRPPLCHWQMRIARAYLGQHRSD
jgi:hypothetical protein